MRLTVSDLEHWARRREAQGLLPQLVRRLIHATIDVRALTRIVMPADEGVGKPGLDGWVETRQANPWVPEGPSAWEMGCDEDYAKKAQDDYRKRIQNPAGVDPAQTTFVFVTPRLWRKTKVDREAWERAQREQGPWKDVRVLDADELIDWLHAAPSVWAWFAELLGRPGPWRTLEWNFREWSRATSPASSEGLVLAGRNDEREVFTSWLRGEPGMLPIRGSDSGEVAAFCWAALGRLPERERTSWRERSLVVVGDDELRRLSLERGPLLLVAQGVEFDVARSAAAEGHHVVLANGASLLRDTLILGALEPARAQLELEQMRIHQDPLELVRRLRGEQPGTSGVPMVAIRRELGGRGQELPPELVPLCLLGGWTTCEQDVRVVCEILGKDVAGLEALLQRHGGEPTSPLHSSSHWGVARWRWASRLDVWRQLETHLTRDVLGRFEQMFIAVFADGWGGSDELRRGLLEGLALLAVEGSAGREHLVRGIVRRLLVAPSVEAWAALAGALPTLAEAAPETFLQCAEHFVSEQLRALDSDTVALSGIITALGVLAWTKDYLFRATELLAKLAHADLDGRTGKRALEVLGDIYLPWSPKTAASSQLRAGQLVWLVREYPDVAVELLPELLSTRVQHVSRGPRYRDWAQRAPVLTRAEADAAYHRIWDCLLELARADARHWLKLFPQLPGLAPDRERRVRAISALTQLDASRLDTDQRENLRGILRSTIHLHREHPSAPHARPEAELEQLEQLHERLAPEDLRDELAWVFSIAPPLLHPPPDVRGDREAARAKQLEAAARLSEKLTTREQAAYAARVSDAWTLGYALACQGDTDKRALALLQASFDEPEGSARFRRGLGYAIHERGSGFAAWDSDEIRSLPPEAQAELLQGFPHGPATWDFARSLGPEVDRAYWLIDRALYPHDRGDLERVVDSLVRVGRAEEATKLVASARGTRFGELSSELVVKLLDATLGANPEVEDHNPHDSFLFTALFGQLRAEGERWRDELLRFEWIVLPALDIYHGDQPLTLYSELARQPEYFAEIVERADAWPRHTQWERAWTLLEHWRGLPGRTDDSIDIDELRRWIREARALLHEANLGEEGDRRLGAVLANAPEGADGRWPHEAVREVFEQLGDAPDVREGLVTARGNQSSTGIIDTERDRARAQKLREDANALRIRQPRTARMLEELARRSEHHAAFWDEEQAQRLDWTSPVTTEVRIDRALDQLETDGRLVFDLDMLHAELGNPSDLPFALERHRRVAHVDDDLYVIVPPEYRRAGAPPPSWYLDELMRRADTDYCLGLLSAAAHHGAANQQPMVVQVLVDRARDALKVGAHAIEFVHRERDQPFAATRVNTPTGTMAVATPEATVFDLGELTERCGGHDAVVEVLEELTEDTEIEALVETAAAYPVEIVAQAADLLGEAGREDLARALREPSPKRALGG